ncbi:MAG TPA: hypothetical protein VE866_18215 [Candidatus Binatia bacterium]|jgi:methyl-accepting chemotaxis protein|nr:hypothetical protein [Candidatus Binatia bacterium]
MRYPVHAIALILVTAGLTLTSPLPQAQPATKAAGEAQSPSYALRKHHELQQVLDDMARTMAWMQEQMDKGELAPEARKDMASSMKKMSAMMHRISALLHRPLMSDAEATGQFETMRRQMDEMEKARPMSEPTRPHPAAAAPGSGAARSLRAEYEMGQLLQDMASEMGRMQDQVNIGKLTPKMLNEISSRMEQMSGMMRSLSSLTAHSAMKDADMRRQLEKMQLQMAHMRDSPEMSGTAGQQERAAP